jgi:hypothetical protein
LKYSEQQRGVKMAILRRCRVCEEYTVRIENGICFSCAVFQARQAHDEQLRERQQRESDEAMDSLFGEGYMKANKANRDAKIAVHTAIFVKFIPTGWRGKQTALYKLSCPLQDFDYVVCNSLITAFATSRFSEREEVETCIYGASEEGNVGALEVLAETETLSHTETLLKAGYKLILTEGSGGEEMPKWIDRWPVTGTSVDKETGKPKEYTVARSGLDEWGCDCMAWINKKGVKVDCQHILRKKLELVQKGINSVPKVKTSEEGSQQRQVRLTD